MVSIIYKKCEYINLKRRPVFSVGASKPILKGNNKTYELYLLLIFCCLDLGEWGSKDMSIQWVKKNQCHL